MVQAGVLRRMPRREIKRKDAKAERKAERQKVGRLSEQRVSLATAERYADALHGLSTFVGSPEVQLLKRADLESVLCEYVEFLWEEGDPKTMANYVMAAVQYRRPELRGRLKAAWQLVSLWNKLSGLGPGFCWNPMAVAVAPLSPANYGSFLWPPTNRRDVSTSPARCGSPTKGRTVSDPFSA